MRRGLWACAAIMRVGALPAKVMRAEPCRAVACGGTSLVVGRGARVLKWLRGKRGGGRGGSYAQMAANQVVVQLGRGASGHHAAAVHNVEALAELADEVEVLLDQHDGHIALGDELFQDMADLLDDVGLDAFGGLVEEEHL